MPVGEVQNYTLFNDNGNKRRIFQNFLDAKARDMVIGYESTPVKQRKQNVFSKNEELRNQLFEMESNQH